jgi:hypothetical protein
MPIWADPARGERVRLLADDDLSLLATFVAPPAARPTAADVRAVPGTDLRRFAAIAARDLPGVRVITRLDEAAALTEAGAAVVSSSVHMVRDRLQEDPPPLRWAGPHLAAGLSVVGVETVPEDVLAASQLVAFGPGHPDHEATLEAQVAGQLHALLAGELLGPVYADASAAVVDAGGNLYAALLATHWEGIGDEWRGGPWLVDLFTVPGAPLLLGRSLLTRAVAVASLDGHAAVGLTVSAGNRARRLYERLGFRDAFYRVVLDLPGAWPAPH